MASLIVEAVALPIAIGLGLSFLIERWLQPIPALLWHRAPADIFIHVALWGLLFFLELSLFRRPWMAVAGVSAALFVLVLISNAKYYSLREPFIYQDFDYFIDVFKHPRLYLPFLGSYRVVFGSAIIALVFLWGLNAEPPLNEAMQSTVFIFSGFSVFAFSVLVIQVGRKGGYPLAFDPIIDVKRLGLLACLWKYSVAERYVPPTVPQSWKLSREPASSRPNIVVVQSESFFDVRTLFSGIRREVLHEYDRLKASAACHGELDVPAWGANTVRSEFSFLSGLSANTLGVHQFNPYRILARDGFPTVASLLKSVGYYTVCVHPYPASFYRRDIVFPRLGFDRFIDIQSFDHQQKEEPYVSDVVLAEKVCSLIDEISDKPIFLFVITMENHGPLHLEKVNPEDERRFFSESPPPTCDDLVVYLRHLRNADRMAGMLRERLSASPDPALLCWYGDHVPIMPKVYAALGAPSGSTNYFIWKNGSEVGRSAPKDIKVSELSRLLLLHMGFANS